LGAWSDKVAGRRADRMGDYANRLEDVGMKEEEAIDKIAKSQEYTGEEERRPKPPKPNCTNYTIDSPPPPGIKVDPLWKKLPKCNVTLVPAAAAKAMTGTAYSNDNNDPGFPGD